MSVSVVSEAKRCLHCKKPLCRTGCPINTPIPDFIELFKNQKLDEAGKMLFENNPFSIICSLVCDHEAQCEGHCILNNKGQHIHISSIENYISEAYLEKVTLPDVPKNGKKVGVVGSGPAGITIAVVLAGRGYDVTIFESREKIGGVLRYGIPDFRLPKTILDRYKKKLLEMGIHIRTNAVIGRTISVDDMFADGYKAVFIGTGVWKPNRLNIPGETFGQVHFAINYLASPDEFDLGESCVVIGAGNSAMDVARTAIRKGTRNVYLMCRRNKSRASALEVEYAEADGVQFMYGASPQQITDDGVIYTQTTFDENGEAIEKTPDQFIKADSVIVAVSQGALHRIVNSSKGIEMNDRDTLATDESGRTTREGIFAAGDVSTGAKTVVEAVRDAKIVANAMDEYMQGLD